MEPIYSLVVGSAFVRHVVGLGVRAAVIVVLGVTMFALLALGPAQETPRSSTYRRVYSASGPGGIAAP